MPNYFPATYQPYYNAFPTQQNITPTISTQMIWVSNEQEALSYPVAPNNAVPLWDSNNPVIYLKQADASGRPTIKIYDLKERIKTTETAVSAEGSNNNTSYAEKADVEKIQAEFDGVKTEIKALRKDLNILKKKREDDDE